MPDNYITFSRKDVTFGVLLFEEKSLNLIKNCLTQLC